MAFPCHPELTWLSRQSIPSSLLGVSPSVKVRLRRMLGSGEAGTGLSPGQEGRNTDKTNLWHKFKQIPPQITKNTCSNKTLQTPHLQNLRSQKNHRWQSLHRNLWVHDFVLNFHKHKTNTTQPLPVRSKNSDVVIIFFSLPTPHLHCCT